MNTEIFINICKFTIVAEKTFSSEFVVILHRVHSSVQYYDAIWMGHRPFHLLGSITSSSETRTFLRDTRGCHLYRASRVASNFRLLMRHVRKQFRLPHLISVRGTGCSRESLSTLTYLQWLHLYLWGLHSFHLDHLWFVVWERRNLQSIICYCLDWYVSVELRILWQVVKVQDLRYAFSSDLSV